MATMSLSHYPYLLNNKCLYSYREKINVRDVCHLHLKIFSFHILNRHGFTFKHCQILSSRKDTKEYKISTVAAYASKVNLIVANETSNFEYDDNEWDIGIGNLIIDLDADIEKTRNEKLNLENGMASTPSTSSNHQIQMVENINSSCSDNKSYSSINTLPSSLPSSSNISSTVTCNANTQIPNLTNIISNTNNSLQLTINSCKTNSSGNISASNHSSKMAVEHSATVDKGLKMKIKRTKPGTKSSEVKHEIVKSNEVNGSLLSQDNPCGMSTNLASTSLSTSITSQCVHNVVEPQCTSLSNKSKCNLLTSTSTGSTSTPFITSKRTSGNHRREKGRDKYDRLNNHASQLSKMEVNDSTKQIIQNNISLISIAESSNTATLTTLNVSSSNLNTSLSKEQNISSSVYTNVSSSTTSNSSSSITNIGSNCNKSIEVTSNETQVQVQGSLSSSRNTAYQITQNNVCSEVSNNSLIYSSNSISTSCSTINTEEIKCSTSTGNDESLDIETDSPPCKRSKFLGESDFKEMSDIGVGTTIGTITEPDCLGPCEPGTSVTLEGIVWHETEGGVLVVNITWRGKTYVGTLLDCTRHDWAPPRFCDSPTSDLDARATKGRTKRGRTTTNITSNNDLSNFTETRSSVHSKLRNTGNKGRRGAYGSPAPSPSSTAFLPPRGDITTKRKPRCLEEEDKSKRRIPPPTPPSSSPPASPVLLECPELNCSKKYKHIDGLKYHQSHAHGSIDDEDIKEVITSMSENDESNIESPSSITPIKSPLDKIENLSNSLHSPNLLEPLSVESSLTLRVTMPDIETSTLIEKNIVKPAILRYRNEDCTIMVDSRSSSVSKSHMQAESKNVVINSETTGIASHSSLPNNSSQQYNTSNLLISSQLQHNLDNPLFQTDSHLLIQTPISQQLSTTTISSHSENHLLQTSQKLLKHSSNQSTSSEYVQNQPITTLDNATNQHNILNNLTDHISSELSCINRTISPSVVSVHSIQTHLQSLPNTSLQAKIPQFKVKPTAALMPEHDKSKDLKLSKSTNFKKKLRKSPLSSPHTSPLNTIVIDGRDDVQSPAYSDISDDTVPTDETDTNGKILKQIQDKDIKSSSQNHLSTHFSMYPYYGQSSYLIQNIQEKSTHEYKMSDISNKNELKSLNIVSIPGLSNLQNLNSEKDKKDSTSSQEITESQTQYYTNYNTYIAPTYPFQTQSTNSTNISHLTELEFLDQKQKIKPESQSHILKEKHLENHQILKESIEIKNQMSPYQLYHNSDSQRPSSTSDIISDDRRYYIYSGEQRRKEDLHKQNISQKSSISPKHQSKQEKLHEINKNDEAKIKQEGVKPTMETQGPPPPPTSQYAYIHPGYIPSHHYGSISYDTGHSGMYRNLTPMIVPGTYASTSYLHQLPRYHAPEDLSRSPGAKALDLLQHHANQYYSNHKIHELQERALKSPIPKTQTTGSSPLSTGQPISVRSPNDTVNNAIGSCPSSQSQSTNIKQQNQNVGQQQQQQPACGDTIGNSSNKDNRSPPPQRHVHTHHHTHVGLGYPILPGQYPAPYGDKSSKQWENGFGVDF